MSPAAGALLIDQPVLARRTEDGLYYSGRVKSQVEYSFLHITSRLIFILSAIFSHGQVDMVTIDLLKINDDKEHG